MDGERYFLYESVVNLRDIGGLNTQDGRRMKSGLLFRSADLSHLSPGEQALLERLQIRLICDLRSDMERQANPNRLPASWPGRSRAVAFDPQLQATTRRQAMHYFTGATGGEDFEKFAREMYRDIAFKHRSQVKAVFDLIGDPGNLPVLIHCTAGKDRTGFIAALVQLLVGVPRPVVVEDYLLTNRFYEPQARRYARRIRWMTLFRAKPDRIRLVFAAKREYLEGVLDEMIQTYGGVEGYLIEGCGLQAEKIEQLREALLER